MPSSLTTICALRENVARAVPSSRGRAVLETVLLSGSLLVVLSVGACQPPAARAQEPLEDADHTRRALELVTELTAQLAELSQASLEEAERHDLLAHIGQLERALETLLERVEKRGRSTESPQTPGDLSAVEASREDAPADGEGKSELAEVPSVPSSRGSCQALAWLDDNRDGKLSGADRYWRHLRLVTQQSDPIPLIQQGVREIALDLRSWGGAKELVGDVELEGWRSTSPSSGGAIWLRLYGKGRRGVARARLAIDANGLARGNGPRPIVEASAGDENMKGIVPLQPGLRFEWPDGSAFELSCQVP